MHIGRHAHIERPATWYLVTRLATVILAGVVSGCGVTVAAREGTAGDLLLAVGASVVVLAAALI
jgi:hypothetical protein